MSEASIGSDKGIGVTLALAAVALVGAVILFGYPTQIGRAWGFAAAFVFALLSVVAVQLFD
ncbi:DUF7525 family protein [Halorubrum tibetense]|uniref:Uncharacterized protein n=1 Tax=Halorubrum tibetense TaxID=175631 RepID=A0ABD5SBU0_9EURY